MTTQVWPADRFFWAVLDAPGVKADQGLPEGLRPLLQEDLPIPIDDAHAVGAATADGKLLVCAARCAELRDPPEECLTLSPADVPPLIETKLDPAAFNLLVGDFEPLPLRRQRARRRAVVTLTGAAVACLAAVGLVRRAEAWNRAEHEARAAISTVGGTPVTLRVEVEKLRKAPRHDAKSLSSADAAVALASLLAGWPKELECETDSVNVGPATMTLALTVAKDARPFLSALKPPQGWIMDEPRLTATGEGARLHLVLHRKEARP